MNTVSIVGVSGKELRWIREKAGLSRPRLALLLARNDGEILSGVSTKTLERYETLPEVPALYVQQYRKVIGAEIFDELLQNARKTSAAGKLEETIKGGNSRTRRKKSVE